MKRPREEYIIEKPKGERITSLEVKFIPNEVLINIFNIYMFSRKSISSQHGKEEFAYDYGKKFIRTCRPRESDEMHENKNSSTIKIGPNRIIGKCQCEYKDCDTYKNELISYFSKDTMTISTNNSLLPEKKNQFKISYNPNVYNNSLIDLRLVSRFWYNIFKIAILNRGKDFLSYYKLNEYKFIDNIPECYYLKNKIPTLINGGNTSDFDYLNTDDNCFETCLICKNLNNTKGTPLYESWISFKSNENHYKKRETLPFILKRHPSSHQASMSCQLGYISQDEESSMIYFPIFFTVLGRIYSKTDNNNHSINNGPEIITKYVVHSPCYTWLQKYTKNNPNFNEWIFKDDKKYRGLDRFFDKNFQKLLCDINRNQINEIYSTKIPFRLKYSPEYL
jgi:hypothetical protein